MRSHTRKQRGGSVFFDNLQARVTNTISNNPNFQNASYFFSNPSLAITEMSNSLFNRATSVKDDIYSRAKARIQGIICSAGGTRRKRKRRRSNTLKY
jgi:hypothetical protein